MHIAPDLVATGVGGPRNPYWMFEFTVPFLPKAFIQSIISTSLCHRILQSSDAPPSDQLALARRFQKHRGHALRALTADLARPDHQTSDLTLASVLLLLLLEVRTYPSTRRYDLSNFSLSTAPAVPRTTRLAPPYGWRHCHDQHEGRLGEPCVLAASFPPLVSILRPVSPTVFSYPADPTR